MPAARYELGGQIIGSSSIENLSFETYTTFKKYACGEILNNLYIRFSASKETKAI